MLEKVATYLGCAAVAPPSAFGTLVQLIEKVWEHLPPGELDAILALRGRRAADFPQEFDAEEFFELLPEDDQSVVAARPSADRIVCFCVAM